MNWMCVFSRKRPTQQWAQAPDLFFFFQEKANSRGSLAIFAISCLSSSPGTPSQCCILSSNILLSNELNVYFFSQQRPPWTAQALWLDALFFPGKPQYSTLAQRRLPRSMLTIFFFNKSPISNSQTTHAPKLRTLFFPENSQNPAFHCRGKKKKTLVGRC